MAKTFPSNIGRYELTGKIGSGSMGAIYRGLDPVIGRQVAIKIIRTSLLDTDQKNEYLVRFQQEVRAAGRCIHSGIVTIYDYGEWQGNPFIVMEYLEGQVLQHLFAKGPLPVQQAVDFALQLLDALSHAHAQGVVHRDIKPANIILGSGSQLKITDFGVAHIDTGSMTNIGTLLGTPGYMAPEQANGEHVDHRADLFSVGVVLFRMLTGKSPYGEDSFAAVLQKVANSQPIDVSAVDEISPLLASVVAVALQKDVSHRFQSTEEFAHSLRSAMTSNGPADAADFSIAPENITAASWTTSAQSEVIAMQEELTRAFLSEMRPLLISAIGPIADHVIARAKKSCVTPSDLKNALEVHFVGAADEQALRKAASKALDKASTPPPLKNQRAGGTATLQLAPDFLDVARTLLTSFIGPISAIVIRQSSFELSTLEEFSDRLAVHIPGAAEQSRFRTRLQALMATHCQSGRDL